MIVEDQEPVREGLRMLIGGSEGYNCVAACRSAEEALERIGEAQPDVVLMDINLPGINGIEATRRILADHPGALIVIVTSHGQEQMVMDAIEAGAKGYILKPVKQEKLAETLDTVVAKYL